MKPKTIFQSLPLKGVGGSLLLCCLLWLCGQQASAQLKPSSRYVAYSMDDSYKNDNMVKLGKGWGKRSIKVPNGGQSPDIVTLVKAFNQTWPNYVVGAVLDKAKNPKFTREVDEEYDTEIIVDRKNGFVSWDSGGTDGDSMEACVWRRNNGHRLFAIQVSSPVDPVITVICFYDYDPKTATLKPEASPVDSFKGSGAEYVSYILPRVGKDFIISEYTDDAYIKYIYTWNGTKHVFSKTTKEK